MGGGFDRKKKRGLTLVKSCYNCNAHVIQRLTTIDYRWGDSLVVIKDVPAGVCEQCGEKYLAIDVYKEVERLASSRDHLTEKMTVDILAYGEKTAA